MKLNRDFCVSNLPSGRRKFHEFRRVFISRFLRGACSRTSRVSLAAPPPPPPPPPHYCANQYTLDISVVRDIVTLVFQSHVGHSTQNSNLQFILIIPNISYQLSTTNTHAKLLPLDIDVDIKASCSTMT
jgi:hypothetical protein